MKASEYAKNKYSLDVKDQVLKPILPKRMTIELNNTCNHNCIFCFAHSKLSKKKLEPCNMDINFAKRILLNAANVGFGIDELGFHISGEPLLYQGYNELVRFSKKLGFKYIYMTTNGALADEATLKTLITSGVDSIRFSVNAATRDSYKMIHGRDDFEKVMKNIKFLNEYRKKENIDLKISASSVYTKKTEEEIRSLKKYLDNFVDEVILIPVAYLNQIDETIEKEYGLNLKEQYEGIVPCPFLFSSFFVNVKGEVIICCIKNGEKSAVMANLHENMDLESIWHSDSFVMMRQLHLEKSLEKSICYDCEFTKKGRKVFEQ